MSRLSPVLLATAVAVSALLAAAPEARADAASLGRAFQQAHAQAAASTNAATQTWSQFPGLERQFYAAMQSPNANVRANAKRTAVQWLDQMHGMLDRAARDHRVAIRRMQAYLRYVGSNPQAENLLYQLQNAEQGLRQHMQAVRSIRAQVLNMR